MYLAAVIPTIDEAETIGDLVRALDKTCDVIYVADGSNDEATTDAAREAGPVVWFRDRGGLAGAYDGADMRIAKPLHVLHIDAGGSHDPADVGPMIELAEEGFDVVIGSRFCPLGEHHGPWRRRVTSQIAACALNLISLRNICDWTSGYRLYSPRARAVLAEHTFTTTGHAWQIESLWVLLQHGMRVIEQPIVYRSSVSHLSSGRVKEAAKLYWRLAWT